MYEFKYSITVGKKPRGLWRPPITLKIWVEGDLSNPLNIDPYYVFKSLQYCGAHCNRCSKFINAPPLPFFFYTTSSARETRPMYKCCCNWTGRIDNSSIKLVVSPPSIQNVFSSWSWTFYPEWRPGIPDYSDYVQFCIEKWLKPCVEEFERRTKEAMESVETEEYTITSDDLVRKEVEKELAQKPTRKLKVV